MIPHPDPGMVVTTSGDWDYREIVLNWVPHARTLTLTPALARTLTVTLTLTLALALTLAQP